MPRQQPPPQLKACVALPDAHHRTPPPKPTHPTPTVNQPRITPTPPPATPTPPPAALAQSRSVIPAPSLVIPAQAGTHPRDTTPFPNSSLPPSRGEVRWGVGGPERAPPSVCTTLSPPHPLPHPAIPAPSLRHSCAGRNHAAHPTTTPFPNSSLPPSRGEVRWGVGGPERAPPSVCTTPSPPHPLPLPPFPRPPSVIPAQAGTHPRHSRAPLPSFLRRQEPRHPPNNHPLPQFIPPPFQGGG